MIYTNNLTSIKITFKSVLRLQNLQAVNYVLFCADEKTVLQVATNSDLYVQYITSDIADCIPNPCQNGAACTDEGLTYSCTCTGNWFGDQCSDCKFNTMSFNMFHIIFQ